VAGVTERFGAPGQGVRILSGGSVKPANAKELLTVGNVAGALVGSASLKATEFLAIARAAWPSHGAPISIGCGGPAKTSAPRQYQAAPGPYRWGFFFPTQGTNSVAGS
jgi:Triosephosphate isomerase